MQPKSSILPVLLLLFFPIPHIWALSYLTEDKSGFWQVGATVFLLMDVIFVLSMLAILKLPSLRWQNREHGLMIVGCLIVMMWVVMGAINAISICFYGVQLLVFAFSIIWLSRQKHLREQK
ncbi:MAG: hypothetical protein QM758_04240 [Armatimonas sp.]